jgi:hypothetical protein
LEISSGIRAHLAGRERESIRMTGSEQRQIDEGYRPASYFGPVCLESHLLSTVKGAERRDMVALMMRDGEVPLPPFLAQPVLPEHTRAAWGAIHPKMMGGEYLPDRRGRELEIARVTIQSVTQDVACVYASQGRGRIRYRVVDEYGDDDIQGRGRRTSLRPLTLGEVTDLILDAWDLIPLLEFRASDGGRSLEDNLAWFSGESAFYPDFDALLQARVEAWWVTREVKP